MFEPRSIAARHTLRPSAVADSADTTITVNSGGGSVPPRPDFRIDRHTGKPAAPATPAAPAATSTNTHIDTNRQINWGGIMKGVAVVAAVVVVAVVAYTVVPALLTSIGLIGEGGLLTGAVQAVSPALSSAGGALMQGINFLDNFVFTLGGNFLNAIGLGGVFSSAAAATTAAGTATVGAINAATGAVAAGATVAMGAPLAIKTMLTTPATTMVDTLHTTPAPTGLEDGGANHAQSTGGHGQSSTRQVSAADIVDMPEEQITTLKTATKVAHHAAEQSEHSNTGAEAGESPAEERGHAALRRSGSTSQAWADRVGHREKHAVTARDSQFAQALADDRSKLDAALAERA